MNAFMATMITQSQPLPTERAVALVREHYGLETRATRLTGERDENFKLSAADGREFVLKIANSAEDPEVSDLPTAALLHLERSDPAFPCPRVVRERTGETQIHLADENGKRRTARMLTFLPGRPLATSRHSQRQRATCGRIGARLTTALRNFDHPAAHRAIIWDLRHVGHAQRLLEQVADFPCRQAAENLLQRIVPTIDSHMPYLRQQILHNDLNPLNVLVDPEDEDRVVGIVDFGDLIHTALIADVAVMAAEQLPEDCTATSGRARASILDIATAYHESVPLLQQELVLLGPLVAARLLTNVVVQGWHFHHNPSGGHYAALDPDFIRGRLEIAAQLLIEEITL